MFIAHLLRNLRQEMEGCPFCNIFSSKNDEVTNFAVFHRNLRKLEYLSSNHAEFS